METKIMSHLVADYPSKEYCLEVAKALIAGGTSYLEIQFPFSDPTADGVYIQRACQKALEQGFKFADGFSLVKKIRGLTELPIFIMSYANPVFIKGIENFIRACQEAGAQGVIIPDLTPDYDEGLFSAVKKYKIAAIPVIAPSISDERLKKISAINEAYIYTSLRTGITGTKTEIGEENLHFLNRVKPLGMKILAGFGIVERQQVDILAPHVHAVIAGSVFIKTIIDHGEEKSPYQPVLSRISSLANRT